MAERKFRRAAPKEVPESMVSDPILDQKPRVVVEKDEEEEKSERKNLPVLVHEDPAAHWRSQHPAPKLQIVLQADAHASQPGFKSQRYALISYIDPKDYGVLHVEDRKYHAPLLKIRGVFSTKEDADKFARILMVRDPHFDLHLVEMFTWSPISDEDVQDREYLDKRIESIVKSYLKSEEDRKNGIAQRIAAAATSSQFMKDPEKLKGLPTDEPRPDRVEEVMNFWEEAMHLKETEAERALPDPPADSRPMTLDEVRATYLADAAKRAEIIEHRTEIMKFEESQRA